MILCFLGSFISHTQLNMLPFIGIEMGAASSKNLRQTAIASTRQELNSSLDLKNLTSFPLEQDLKPLPLGNSERTVLIAFSARSVGV